MSAHKQVEIDGIQVDEGLAVIMTELWKRGIETRMSCQEDVRTSIPSIWIGFSGAKHLESFLTLTRPIYNPATMGSVQWGFRVCHWHPIGEDLSYQYDVWIPVEHKEAIEKLLTQ